MKKLSRSEMKKLQGGGQGGCPGNYWWLVCSTPNGTESWCRSSNSGDANTICAGIYPAYNEGVSGNWAPVVIVE